MTNKSLAMLLIASFLGFTVHAAEIQYGSACGLIDEADDFELTNASTQHPTQATELSDLQKKQIIVAADSEEDLTGIEALQTLIEGSEGGDLDYTTGTFKGKVFDMVRSYPGGNPVATIFEHGSQKPFAYISDSDVICAAQTKK